MEEYASLSAKNAAKIEKASKKLADKIFKDLVTSDRSISEAEGIVDSDLVTGKSGF